ncbi:MAG: hypothetical protein WCJ22_03465, partial [Actinomycetes bacterium]
MFPRISAETIVETTMQFALARLGANTAPSSTDLRIVVGVACVSLLALVLAGFLVRQVLSASEGTANMQEIAKAVQVGASAF